jgi:hypothetical protein
MTLVRVGKRRVGTSRPAALLSGGVSGSYPDDPRTNWPLSRRRITQTELPGGTILTSFEDPPLTEVELAPAAAVELPEEIEDDRPQTWRADKPKPPEGPGRWGAGPLPRRGA